MKLRPTWIALIRTLIAGAAVLSLVGCAGSRPASAPREAIASVAETGTPFPGLVFHWTDRLPPVSLDAALVKVGTTISLPDPSIAGTQTKVSTAPFGWPDGTQGLLVLYSSGVQLLVRHDDRVLQVTTAAVPYTDGRKTSNTLRQVDGTPVFIQEAGALAGVGRQRVVPAMLNWNAGGLRYTLYASNENSSTAYLIAIMRTMRPAAR